MFNSNCKYHAHVYEPVTVEYATPVACFWEHRPEQLDGELAWPVRKGIYSFHMAKHRDAFVAMCNSQGTRSASKL